MSLSGSNNPPTTGNSDSKWLNYTPEMVARSRSAPLKQTTIASNILLNKLNTSGEQLEQIKEKYMAHATVDHVFAVEDSNQLVARTILAQHGLDADARERRDNRWSIQWSRYSNGKDAKTGTKRVLYLCRCGSRHKSQNRGTPIHTSCLAHGEITYAVDSLKILRIRGYLQHNEACEEAESSRVSLAKQAWDRAMDELDDIALRCGAWRSCWSRTRWSAPLRPLNTRF
ncbi:hypothetical protein DFH06DRAFT_129921 [Mycena polygramma]|nr:hypothetical protein DFH06DRAFT_129921 [Mycena polygramma]